MRHNSPSPLALSSHTKFLDANINPTDESRQTELARLVEAFKKHPKRGRLSDKSNG